MGDPFFGIGPTESDQANHKSRDGGGPGGGFLVAAELDPIEAIIKGAMADVRGFQGAGPPSGQATAVTTKRTSSMAIRMMITTSRKFECCMFTSSESIM